MESSKYYTPELEEFHIGFEYEVKNRIWDKVISTEDIDYDSIDYHLSYKDIRTKYLNQEDIESLGWELGENNTYHLNNWSLKYWDKKNKISIIIRDPSKNDDSLLQNIMTSVNFLNIKNKSELKKLMTQLNV